MNLLKTTLAHFKPYWRKLLLALTFSVIGGAFTILPPILAGKLVDEVIGAQETTLLLGLLAVYLSLS